jgi:hypothetical protein
MKTRLEHSEMWFDQYPNSFLNRVNETIDFIKPRGLIMDCGENNPMKEMIEHHFGCSIDSVDWDFNEPVWDYRTR